jgi:hypothetical protein
MIVITDIGMLQESEQMNGRCSDVVFVWVCIATVPPVSEEIKYPVDRRQFGCYGKVTGPDTITGEPRVNIHFLTKE